MRHMRQEEISRVTSAASQKPRIFRSWDGLAERELTHENPFLLRRADDASGPKPLGRFLDELRSAYCRISRSYAGVAQLGPSTERDADTGAGGGAIERLVFEPAAFHALDRAGEDDPVADLGRAGIECRDRQAAQECGPPGLEAADHATVQILVDNEMAEAARGHHGDAQILLAAFDAP